MAFDYKKALESGATEDQVLDYLNKTRGYDVMGAINAGASKAQVMDYLSNTSRPDTNIQPISEVTEDTNPNGAILQAKPGENPLVAGGKAIVNLPSSAYNTAKGVVKAALNPIDTAMGVGNIIRGGLNKASEKVFGASIDTPEMAAESEQAFGAFAKSLKDRFGSLDNLQKTATEDPFGFGSDVLGLVTGGATLAGKAGTVANTISKVGQVATSPAVKLAEKAANFGATAKTKILSYTSDVPEQAFERLLQNRETITPKIGVVDQVKALDTARTATRTLRKTLSAEWDEGIDNIVKTFEGQRLGLPNNLQDKLVTVADEFGIDIPIGTNFSNLSAKEMTYFLKKINELPKPVLTFSPKGAVVRELKDSLKSIAVKNFGGDKGEFANLYKNYSAKKSVFDAANDLVNAYNEGRPIKDTTAMNRLQNIFDENKPAYLDAILDLEKTTGINIIDDVVASKFMPKMPNTMNKLSSAGGLGTKKGLLEKAVNVLAFPLTSPRSAGFIQRNLKLKVPQTIKDINNFKTPAIPLITKKKPTVAK
jgi:hypothetical protein